MKIAAACLLAIVGLLSAACNPGAPAVPPLTGDSLAASLQASGLPVTSVRVFNVDTDPEKLMGRPGQYTARASWFDQRVAIQDGLTVATVEAFPDMASMDARAKSVAAVSGAFSAFAEYQFRNDSRRVLLRLPHDLTPDQAATYKAWLDGL